MQTQQGVLFRGLYTRSSKKIGVNVSFLLRYTAEVKHIWDMFSVRRVFAALYWKQHSCCKKTIFYKKNTEQIE